VPLGNMSTAWINPITRRPLPSDIDLESGIGHVASQGPLSARKRPPATPRNPRQIDCRGNALIGSSGMSRAAGRPAAGLLVLKSVYFVFYSELFAFPLGDSQAVRHGMLRFLVDSVLEFDVLAGQR